MNYQITHVRQDTRADADYRIDAMAGPSFGATAIDTLIAWHQQGHRFYVMLGQTVVWLRLMRHSRSLRLFFQTEPDGRYDNNLYALPPC